MPLPIFDSADAIPEPFRDAYEERDGRWHPVADAAPAADGLKATLDKLRERLDATEKQLRAADRRAQEAERAARETVTAAKAKAAGLTDDQIAEFKRQAAEEYQPKLAELDALRAEVRALKLDSTVKAKLAPHVLDVDVMWKLIGDEFDLTADGTPVLKANPTADIDKYVTTDLRQRYDYLYRGTQAAGGGAVGSRAGLAADSDNVFAWTTDQRRAFITAHGPQAYQDKLDAATLASVTKAKQPTAA